MLQIRDFIEEDRQAYLEMARDFTAAMPACLSWRNKSWRTPSTLG